MKRALKRLDLFHEKLLQTIAPIDLTTFSQRPSDNEWSVAEIVHHLALVEELVTMELAAAIEREPQRVGFLRRLIPTSIVSYRLLRVKAPRAVRPVAVPERNVVIQNFEAARRNFKALCDTHGGDRFKNLVFRHPFLGNIDGVATVSFVGYHELRHYKQICEVLRKIGASG